MHLFLGHNKDRDRILRTLASTSGWDSTTWSVMDIQASSNIMSLRGKVAGRGPLNECLNQESNELHHSHGGIVTRL